jgi:hypothetical protein
MTEEHGDEAPPTPHVGRTPAERAGATPLDPERFKANAGMPMVQREREIVGRVPEDEEPVAPVVRRRRGRAPSSTRRRPGSGRAWLVADYEVPTDLSLATVLQL